MINLDQEACIGCGACAAVCPHSFAMADDGKAGIVSQDIVDCTREAAEGCPVQAIKIE